MRKFQIPSAVALVLGLTMAIWSGKLPLHQNEVANQTAGEFVVYVVLAVGGVFIAIVAVCGLARSLRQW